MKISHLWDCTPPLSFGVGRAELEVTRRVKFSRISSSIFSIGAEGFTTQEDQELLSRIEKQLKRRFAIGSQVSEHSIVQDFVKQVGPLDRDSPWWGSPKGYENKWLTARQLNSLEAPFLKCE